MLNVDAGNDVIQGGSGNIQISGGNGNNIPNVALPIFRSFTEPFNEEMELEEIRVKRWLAHFGLLADENSQWHQIHVSGHGSGDQIRNIIQDSASVAIFLFTQNMKSTIRNGTIM